MRVIITGGGTGGHTSAGLAVAEALRSRGVEVLWIGSREGIEATRVPAAGIPYHPIPAGKLRRSWTWQNIPDLLGRVPAAFLRSQGLLRRLRPQLLFATGGFVALPPAIAARALGIPVVIHEQTAVAGLANRIAGRFASKAALTFPEAGRSFPPDRVVVTGNPLRPELAGGSREGAVARLGLDPALPLVYVTGGAQGSHRINRVVGEILPRLLDDCQVIHQCGANPTTKDRQWLEEQAARLADQFRARYHLLPHVGPELGDIYAGASLVVSRAGAGTVNECCHLGKPALFIPLPSASGDEQTANARLVERVGGAVVLPEAHLTADRLLETIHSLLADRDRLSAMGERAQSLAVSDAAERLADLIVEVAEKGPQRTDGAGGREGRSAAGMARNEADLDSSASPPPPGARGTR